MTARELADIIERVLVELEAKTTRISQEPDVVLLLNGDCMHGQVVDGRPVRVAYTFGSREGEEFLPPVRHAAIEEPAGEDQIWKAVRRAYLGLD